MARLSFRTNFSELQELAEGTAFVARQGFEAMKKGEGEVIPGSINKMQAAIAHITPADVSAEMHSKMAAPGTAEKGAT